MVEMKDGYEVHVISEKGYFLTSAPNMDYRTVTDKYYYMDKKGDRIKLDDFIVLILSTVKHFTLKVK